MTMKLFISPTNTPTVPRAALAVTLPARTPAGASSAAPEAVPPGPPPRLADGVELLGRYEGSGFKEPPFLARRADGQMIQLPRLLYLIAEAATGERDHADIARDVGEAIERKITSADLRFLAEERLRPLGILAPEGGRAAEPVAKPDALLALKLKTALVAPEVVRVIGTLFSPLFFPPVILAVFAAAVGVDVWLFWVHGVAQSLQATLYEPATLLIVIGLVVLSAAFHECGHAAATRYGGAEPGAMGAGLYIVWPAFYTDLTDTYRLGRRGRLRADLGGVYFNTIFILLTAGAYFATGFEPLLLLIPLQHLEIVHQLLPVLRLDGYYIISDLTGVPDILSRIKPTLKSLLPGTKRDPRVHALKPWARAVVTGYVLILVPVLVFSFSMMAVAAPRIFATAWDALVLTWQNANEAVDRRQALPSLLALIQLAVLALTPVALGLTLVRAVRGVSGALWRGTETRPRTRAVLVAICSATATTLFLSWWANGAYRPIADGERGTVSPALLRVGRIVGSQPPKPIITPARQREAPARSRRSSSGRHYGTPDPATTDALFPPSPWSAPQPAPAGQGRPAQPPTSSTDTSNPLEPTPIGGTETTTTETTPTETASTPTSTSTTTTPTTTATTTVTTTTP
jgi:putative peptide zinc metalloprotease protein